ncbi:hypothetical protein JH06_1875 [Blastocystis sp. subtype 4]|uniref:hypothetical protein n=1 Tax=Blastocystis sp. subtype 4 TaxID=944170 RepID=UPI0007119CC5|nr:hypothetical protein JH06_1875 [Blastocystis sp. subtype 4]KNB45501.1 hypothetical protein JH06_1875 [Blastocystis sp. subtype 4]|eukprot:XP_014528934.1 hypothetical protein JH06_1875 [Blastocystis sp. subtype 4]
MFSSLIKHIPYRAFSAVTLSPAEQLFEKIYNGVQVMKSLNDPFVVEKTTNQLSINKQTDKEFTITLLHNGNLRFLSPEK